ncbi:MAG: hypothetical protein LLF76_11415 [Planctomycetaceae bacterium]|nr:hypothetical protein [Planctomycetaceae bacterium]
MSHEWLWVFNGKCSAFPSAVFEDKLKAELWIKQHGLVGTLTQYPVNISAYDWALEHDSFKPKKEHQTTSDFIGRFTAGFIWHEHYDAEHVSIIGNYDDVIAKTIFEIDGWVWVFNGDGGVFPSGVFETQDKAELWINHYLLSGTLVKYPVGISVYAWAIKNGVFTPEDEVQRSAAFISTFGRGYTNSVYYKDGVRLVNGE